MAIYLYVYLEIHVFLFELLLFISFACFVVEEILFSFFASFLWCVQKIRTFFLQKVWGMVSPNTRQM